MSSKASIPTELYQANVDLAVRIASLLQENGKSWIGLFTDAAGLNAVASWPDLRGAGGQFSLEKLASLPAETAARLFRGDADYWKNLLSTAVHNQHQFAQGLRDAVEAWQTTNRKALGKAGGSVAGLFDELPGVAELFGVFRDYLDVPKKAANAVLKTAAAKPASAPAPVEPAPVKPTPAKAPAKAVAGPKPAAPKKPAAKKAAVKKAPAKTAVKQAAPPAPAPAKKAPAKKAKAASKVAIVEAPKPMLATPAPKSE